jgi:MOB kinase activator 1
MSAGPKYEYLWVDGAGEPQRMTAPAYIERLLDWVDEKLEDETLFPVLENWPFATGFRSSAR